MEPQSPWTAVIPALLSRGYRGGELIQTPPVTTGGTATVTDQTFLAVARAVWCWRSSLLQCLQDIFWVGSVG